MKCEEIISRLEEEYPLSCAEEWDNPGLLVGRNSREVNRILVALDATEESIRQAVDWGADLLVTHHPLLFHSIKKINEDSFIGRRILTMIEHEICCYACHTNFDVLGMARINEKQLQLQDAHVLEVTAENGGVEEGLGRIGELPQPMTLGEVAEFVRRQLKLPDVRCYGLEDDGHPADAPMITKVAVCGGSGRSVVDDAIREGAQVLVTGDIDYHTGIDALANGLHIIDAGHYGTEYVFIEYMTRKLEQLFPDCEVRGAKVRQPFTVV